MQKLFSGYGCATDSKASVDIQLWPVAIVARSQKEACGIVVESMKEMFPGYSHYDANLVEVDRITIAKLALENKWGH